MFPLTAMSLRPESDITFQCNSGMNFGICLSEPARLSESTLRLTRLTPLLYSSGMAVWLMWVGVVGERCIVRPLCTEVTVNAENMCCERPRGAPYSNVSDQRTTQLRGECVCTSCVCLHECQETKLRKDNGHMHYHACTPAAPARRGTRPPCTTARESAHLVPVR